nr:VOC family protein [Siphonobacter sp. SORGH_AS_0500]
MAHFELFVHDYDEAISFYTTKLGFTLFGRHEPKRD